MAPRKLTLDPRRANGRHRGPNMDEDSMADHDAEFAHYGEDPWRTVRRALNMVSLDAVGGDVEDPSNRSYLDDEVEAPERDLSDLIAAMQDIFNNVLTKQEQRVLIQRLLGDTYATIAGLCRPRLSGPSQARKIEQRAMRKLRERLSRFRKHLTPKLDKSDL
jgi:DNA-directed RNA polymerase sigma subunit (sigma70/sigma32)